jgi:hemerythrin-like domain-containing protein
MIQIQKQINPPVVDGPLEHLNACHRRIEHRLDVLQRAADLLPDRAEEALQAISNSLRFMDISGVLHTVDEEESLFPRLRQAMTPGEIAYLAELESQHREADSLYAALKEVVARLRSDHSEADITAYREVVSRLRAVYLAHIASEDQTLIALAGRVLTADQLSAIQSEMRSRRR